MNKSGQVSIGLIVLAFVGILVGVILIDPVADNVAVVTSTAEVVNRTSTFPAVGGLLTLNGQATYNHIATNASNGYLITSGNYTITNYVTQQGQLVSILNASPAGQFNGLNVNLSYTYEPFGYARDGGTRSIITLIILFMALAVAAIALIPTLRSGVLEMLGR